MDYAVKLLSDIFLESFIIFVIAGSVFAFFIGLLAFFKPQSLIRLNQASSKWVSARRALKPLEVTRPIEPLVYRRRAIIAPLILAGALYTLYVIVFDYDAQQATAVFSPPYDKDLVSWLLQNTIIVLVIGSILGIILAIFMLVRPLQLGKIEAWANRSVSTRTALKGLDAAYYQPDRFVTEKPRLAAAFIILGSLYVMLNFAFFLL